MSRNKPACLNKKVPLTSLSHWHWKLITQNTRPYDASPEKKNQPPKENPLLGKEMHLKYLVYPRICHPITKKNLLKTV